MYIYKVNEDGVTCSVQAHRSGLPVPNGWTVVPPHLENKTLYINDGEVTDQKPQSLINQQIADSNEKNALGLSFKSMVETLTYTKIDAHIENVFGSLTLAQKNSLKNLYRTVLFLAKNHPAMRKVGFTKMVKFNAVLTK